VRGGIEYTQPFYWNISQNMDATIAPRFMAKRGTLWKGEYRYTCSRTTAAPCRASICPTTGSSIKRRSTYSLTHRQNLGYGFSGSLDLNGASDDTFFNDLASGSSVVAQTNLLRQGTLSYSGDWWSANLLAQSYQTLQDPSLPVVTEPYRRLPQLTVSASRGDLPLGMSFAFSGEHVNFRNPTLVQGRRFTLYPQVSLPLQTEMLSFTPKIGPAFDPLHLRPAGGRDARKADPQRSDLQRRFGSHLRARGGLVRSGADADAGTAPLLPLRAGARPEPDSGIRYGYRGFQLCTDFRRKQVQRRRPHRRCQPGYRDAYLAPAGPRDRCRDHSCRLRPALLLQYAERRPSRREVLRSDRQTDFLAAFSGRILPKTYADVGVQYNPRLSRMERLNIGARYQPETGKVLNAGYRYTRDQLTQPGLAQIDISGQWPVFDGWHAVGRFNYSTKDRRMVESVAGLEYDGGCWVGRIGPAAAGDPDATLEHRAFLPARAERFCKSRIQPARDTQAKCSRLRGDQPAKHG
jgi:LPS-assembly protein